MSGWQVMVNDRDPLRRTLEVAIWRDRDELGHEVLRPDGTIAGIAKNTPLGPDEQDWLWQFPREVLVPLSTAIRQHLGDDFGEAAWLRKDYDAERARVDRMLDALASQPLVLMPGADGTLTGVTRNGREVP